MAPSCMLKECMPNFLLVTVPFLTADIRYYPAAYLAGIVKMSGWNIRYLDFNILIYSVWLSSGSIVEWNSENQLKLFNETKHLGEPIIFDAFMDEFNHLMPDMIGLSLMSSNRLYAQMVLEVLDKMEIEIPVIYGGPDCFPREYYKDYFSLKFTPDAIITGEAEIALPEFLDEYSKTKDVKTSINGFVFRDNDGYLVDTGSPKISLLKEESFFADYSIFDYEKIHYTSENKIVTFCSKGCINKCSFCSESRNYGPYRRRKVENVVAEIEQNLLRIPDSCKDNVTIVFRDSIFNASTKYIREICELIISKKLNITWFCLGGFRVQLDADLLDLMYRSGLRSIFYGFESASQRVVDLMGKNYDMRAATQAIGACVERGVTVILPIINGFPGEFTRDFLTTLGFILKYRSVVEFGYSNTCGIFKNTPLSEYPEDFCIETVAEVDYSLRDGFNTLPVRQLRQIINDALRKKQKISESHVLQAFDFNVTPVAAELGLMIFFIADFLQRWPRDSKILQLFFSLSGGGKTHADSANATHSYLVNIVPGCSLEGWFASDKNKPEYKAEIIALLSDLIEALEEKIISEAITIEAFRNTLYKPFKGKLSKVPPPGFALLEERFSRYDKEGHVVFEGTFSRLNDCADISAVEARCGDYCFDIHHWAVSAPGKEWEGGIRFWGKVSLKMLQKSPLIARVRYSNNSTVVFKLPLSLVIPLDNPPVGGGLLSTAKKLMSRCFPFGQVGGRVPDFNK